MKTLHNHKDKRDNAYTRKEKNPRSLRELILGYEDDKLAQQLGIENASEKICVLLFANIHLKGFRTMLGKKSVTL
jgi:hypothetical protein